MIDIRTQYVEERRQPLGVVGPGLSGHEVAVADGPVDPRTAGSFDLRTNRGVGRDLAALKHAGGMPVPAFPSVEATLTGKLRSEPGVRTYARVRLDESGEEDRAHAEPVHTSGSGVLSTVALADGWVVIPESVEGYAAGETVTVEQWEVEP